jgi:RNA polymerase sigma-70 factor, ECF subfamily
MTEQEQHNLFSELIARYQGPLYYIFAVVKNRNDAEDLFQSVCLVLWRKFASFRPNTNFFSWAHETAKLVLCGFLRQKKKWNSASEELLNALADTASNSKVSEDYFYLAAFRRCREKLASSDEELLRFRYIDDLGIREIAGRLQRLPPNVCRSLNRVRRWLLDCVRKELARQEHPIEGCHE